MRSFLFPFRRFLDAPTSHPLNPPPSPSRSLIRHLRSFGLASQRASLFVADGNGYVRDGQGNLSRSSTRLAASDSLFNSRQSCFHEGRNTGHRYREPIWPPMLSADARARGALLLLPTGGAPRARFLTLVTPLRLERRGWFLRAAARWCNGGEIEIDPMPEDTRTA